MFLKAKKPKPLQIRKSLCNISKVSLLMPVEHQSQRDLLKKNSSNFSDGG